MAVKSTSYEVTSGTPVLISPGRAGTSILISTNQTILIGGPDAQLFPITSTDDTTYEVKVGAYEALWAVASSTTATVVVLEYGV